jgi:hypothetical protein
MSFIEAFWIVVAIIGGNIVSSSIISMAKMAIRIAKKGAE